MANDKTTKTDTAGWEETEDEFGDIWEPKEGDSITGEYLGTKSVQGDTDTFLSHKIKEGPGKIHAVAGARLDQLMEHVPEGGMCSIKYLGEKVLDKKRTMRDFKVFQPKGQAAETRKANKALKAVADAAAARA